jgi:heptosyltransferase-2
VEPSKIFVRAPNWVGDMVMATPAFESIRRGYPRAEIVCGLRPWLRSLLDGSGFFDRFIETPRAGGLGGLCKQVKELRREDFDLAIILPNSFETGLVPFLARIPVRVGYRQGRPLLMNVGLRAQRLRGLFGRRGPRRVPEPMPLYYARLLKLLELPELRDRGTLTVTDEERSFIDVWARDRGIGPDDKLLLLNAGASYGASKLWEEDRFAAVARHFADAHGMVPVFLAGPNEVDMVDRIATAAGAIAAINPVLPVHTLKALVERAQLMITTDAGPRHVAVAMGVPVVCLMGPNDPRYTNYGLDRQIVIQKAELECVPCQKKQCPLGHRQCMTTIMVDEVVVAGEQLLDQV